MPTTTRSSRGQSAKKEKVKKLTPGKKRGRSIKSIELNSENQDNEPENAYEWVLRKVQEKRKAQGEDPDSVFVNKRAKITEESELPVEDTTTVEFIEDDNIVTMHVTSKRLREEFPNSEEDGDLQSENDSEVQFLTQNNNAMVRTELFECSQPSAPRSLADPSRGDNVGKEPIPSCSDSNPGMTKTFGAMKNFMIRKGIIDSSLTEEEILEFIETDQELEASQSEKQTPQVRSEVVVTSPLVRVDEQRNKTKQSTQGAAKGLNNSLSEVTVYKRAVQQINPQLDLQIEDLLKQTHLENKNKESSSSDEYLDISDEGCCLNDS